MLLLLCALGLAQEIDPEGGCDCEEPTHRDIMIAIPNIHHPALIEHIPEMTKSLFIQSYVDSQWLTNIEGVDSVTIHDMYSIKKAQDTVCDYREPLRCGLENMHWVLLTDVYTSENSAIINMKLYNENGEIISRTAMPSSAGVSCQPSNKPSLHHRPDQREAARSRVMGKDKKQCVFLEPQVLYQDVKSAVTMLFSSITPL